jgi:PAS domain S-box-containing protein
VTLKRYDDMTRQQLLAEVRALLDTQLDEVSVLRHDLEVHREELVAQHVQLQQTQGMLESSRDAYAELFDFAPVAYLSLDPNGLIQTINLTGCTFLERERSRLIGLPLYSFFVDNDRAKFLDHMRRCRMGEIRVESELTLRTRAGNDVICLIITRPDGRPATSFRTVLTDITERRRAAQSLRELNARLEERVITRTIQLQSVNDNLKNEIAQREAAERALYDADKRKDDFLAMLGHELRNPLAPIRNAAEILEATVSGDPALQEIADVLKRQTSHLTRMVDDLLDVARITRGKITLQRQTVDLRTVVTETLRDIQNSDEANEQQFVANLPKQAVWVYGDVTRLTQILNNLLNNSVKFNCPRGRIVVDLTTDEPAKLCRLTVSDTGKGIEEEMLKNIFDAFTQLSVPLDRRQGGLGLGLAVVRGLVELHGGKVSANSEGLGKGTQVTLELALVEPPRDASRPGAQLTHQGSHSILLIDDSHDSLRMLKSLLESLGQHVQTAEDAETGLELARSVRPEAIISDIGLPRMDGYELARSVRSDAELRSVFLVALTGYGRPQDLQHAKDAGFDRHITKPVGLDELEEIVAGLGQRQT